MNKLLFAIYFSICFQFSASAAANFKLEQAPDYSILKSYKGSELCQLATNTLNYLNNNKEDSYAVHGGSINGQPIDIEKVKATLTFICQTYREDVRAGRQSRLHNNEFLNQHVNFYRWYPDKTTATKVASKSTNQVKTRMLNNIPSDKLFLTKYYTKLIKGSPVKTVEYNQALYQLPNDEIGLSLAQAEQKKDKLTRYKFTRQQVLEGTIEKNALAKPLVWITEQALHDVLLQGTAVLEIDGKTRYFNVHRNNGISYDYHIGKTEQARYWYFAEVPNVMGYGKEITEKIPLYSQISLAGNVKQLGLGKLFLISFDSSSFNQSRLAILADEGGAFDNNLFQLDLLVDSYWGWTDYHQANKHIPDYASVWMLLLKDK